MKKWFYVLMAAIVAMVMMSCSDDNNNNEGDDSDGSISDNCTIELQIKGNRIYATDFRIGTLHPEEFIINWGDGTEETYTTEAFTHQKGDITWHGDYWLQEYYAKELGHIYEDNAEEHTITITGKRILELLIHEVRCMEVDVTRCETLECLKVAVTTITSLDVSHNPKLVYLNAGDNPTLATLDVRHNPELLFLGCSLAKISTLDLSNNTKLQQFNGAGIRELTSLDVSHCPNLETLNLTNSGLSSLNISNCKKLHSLNCENNRLTTLDVSDCVSLTHLECQGNQLTSLNINGCSNLSALYCGGNQFTEDAMTEVYKALPEAADNTTPFLVFDKYEYGEIWIATKKGWKLIIKE